MLSPGRAPGRKDCQKIARFVNPAVPLSDICCITESLLYFKFNLILKGSRRGVAPWAHFQVQTAPDTWEGDHLGTPRAVSIFFADLCHALDPLGEQGRR
ncbi:hypothetical protein AVEN_37723-1, partial [Araneus ventricosus]